MRGDKMTYVIAECGVNWRSLSEAARLIKFVGLQRANAVKFQAYRDEDIRSHERYQELHKIKLDPAKVSFLKGVAVAWDVDFILTPFYKEAVAWSEVYVDKFKIRYADRYNVDIISSVITTGKHMIVSCDHEYLENMPQMVRHYNNKTLMFCVPEYPPAKEPDYNACIGKFSGFSSHYPDFSVPLIAARTFADVVEVHVCADTHQEELIDYNVSLSCVDFRWFIAATKDVLGITHDIQ